MKYSASKENHLKAIFHLQNEHGMVTTNALAAALQTRPASVTRSARPSPPTAAVPTEPLPCSVFHSS